MDLRKWKKRKYVESDNEFDDELNELKALLARRIPRGKDKYKGKIPLIDFTCNKVDHISTRCPNKDTEEERKDFK